MESISLLVFLAGILLISGVSKRIRNTIITLPMLYVLFGLLAAFLVGDWLDVSSSSGPLIEFIATLTLVLVLASDASRIKLRNVIAHHTLPLRLLGIGLPLTIVLGTVVGVLLFGQLGLWGAAILAVILAPTDASLGQSVVDNPKVPVRIRQALNIESGLNDGIALPFLMLALALALSSEVGLGSGAFLGFVAAQVIFGTLAGAGLGYLGARYIHWGQRSGWMSTKFQKICWLALVLLAYLLAELIGGNGFIAAFVFGIVSGNVIGPRQMSSLDDFVEVENNLLMLLTYIMFGLVLLIPALQRLNLAVVLYTLLSLTLVRMLPVAICLIGTKLQPLTVLFMGWFGPRGIASILYVLTVLAADELAGKEIIYTVAMTTVFISVIVHGLSAAPLSDWYGNRMAALDQAGAAEAETKPVPEMPTRSGSPSSVVVPS